MSEVRKRQGWGLIQSADIEPGAVSGVAPEYIEVGNIGADISGGSITSSFKTIKSFAGVTLNAGEKISFQFNVAVAAEIKSPDKRKIQVQLVLDGNAIGNGLIVFKKEKLQTRSTVVVNGYEAESALSGALELQIKAPDTSKFSIKEKASTYYVYARIPDQ